MSAWTHMAGLFLSLPASVWLVRQAGKQINKKVGFGLFGLGLFVCYLGSTLWHTFHLETFARLDYIGIFLLIAGTTTGVVLGVFRGRWRWGMLSYVWTMAVLGIALAASPVRIPNLIYTAFYLAMGWMMCICYFELVRILGHRKLVLLLAGAIFYSLGAVINTSRWPSFWPQIFEAHELFHLFVMAGSLAHFFFMAHVVSPFRAIRHAPALALEPEAPFQTAPFAMQISETA